MGRVIAAPIALMTVLVMAAVAVLAVSASPASARAGQVRDATIEIETLIDPPRQATSVVPIEVTVTSPRAARGVISIEARRDGAPVTYEIPVELPANTAVTIPTTVLGSHGGVNLAAVLSLDGVEPVRNQFSVFPDNDDRQIATLGLEGPETLTTVGGYRASVAQIDSGLIESTGLRHLGMLVASPAALRDLSADERTVVLGWVGSGGSLVVAGESGSIDGQLPAEWSDSARPGGGRISYAGDDWQSNLAPPPTEAIEQFNGPGGGLLGAGFDGNYTPITDLVADAGLRLPGIGLLLGLLGAYILVAGPASYLVLRRVGRLTSAWVILPAIALAFTVGAIVAGFGLRGDRTDAHMTIVEVQPVGSTARTDVLFTATLRGNRTITMPAGWNLVGAGDNWGGGGSVPITVRPSRTSTDLSLGLEAGGAAVMAAEGPVASLDNAIVISDVQVDGDEVTGSVQNNLNVDVHEVLAFAGRGVGEIGTVSAGASTRFSVTYQRQFEGSAREFRHWPQPFSRWHGPGRDNEGADSVVGSSTWAAWRLLDGWNTFAAGSVGVVGWSDELASEALGVDTGRTGLVARAGIPTQGAAEGREAATPHLIVTSGGARNGGFVDGANFFGYQFSNLVDLSAADPAELALVVNRDVAALEFWTDQGWMSATLPEEGEAVIAVPAEASTGESMLVRTSVPEWTYPMQPGLAVIGSGSSEASELLSVPIQRGGPEFRTVEGGGRFPPFGGIPEPFPEPMLAPTVTPGPEALSGPTEGDLGVDESLVVEGSSAAVDGALPFRTYDVYRLEVAAGADIRTVLTTNTGDIDLRVLAPNGDVVPGEFTAQQDGEYVIEVRAGNVPRIAGDAGEYRLEVEITR